MTWTRLRQVALVAHDLDALVADLHEAFGLEVAYRDPAVATFGLHNAVLPIGHQFIEVVSPTRPGGDDLGGPWMPAGPDWQRAVRTDVVDGISGVTVASTDPGRTAQRWAEILELDVVDGAIALDNSTVRFVERPIDSLTEVTVTGASHVEPVVIGGVRFASG